MGGGLLNMQSQDALVTALVTACRFTMVTLSQASHDSTCTCVLDISCYLLIDSALIPIGDWQDDHVLKTPAKTNKLWRISLAICQREALLEDGSVNSRGDILKNLQRYISDPIWCRMWCLGWHLAKHVRQIEVSKCYRSLEGALQMCKAEIHCLLKQCIQ